MITVGFNNREIDPNNLIENAQNQYMFSHMDLQLNHLNIQLFDKIA